MREYLKLIQHVLINGMPRETRTGVKTLSVFGYSCTYDLADGFPLVSVKETNFPAVVAEMLWFLKGSTNVKDLHPVKIWDAWADEDGEVGPVYGYQWRNWPDGAGGVLDQIEILLAELKANPTSRRLIVSAWNVADLNKMSLPPCPVLFQLYRGNDGTLSMAVYQRSADVMIGVPFDVAGYALLLSLFAREVKAKPGKLIHFIGDAHIYEPHLEAANRVVNHTPLERPELVIADKPLFELLPEDITLLGYAPHPKIKLPVMV